MKIPPTSPGSRRGARPFTRVLARVLRRFQIKISLTPRFSGVARGLTSRPTVLTVSPLREAVETVAPSPAAPVTLLKQGVNENRPSPHRYLRLLRWLVGPAIGLPLFYWVLLPLLLPLMPLPPALLDPPPPDLQLTDRHGEPLRELYDDSGHQGERLAPGRIPENLVRATLAAEDRRFWRHDGVDWRAVLRATRDLVLHRRVVSGASTITMQLVKMSNPRPRTFKAKIIESLQALRLEQVWSKEQILAEYLNRLDYGHRRLGCAAAARYYFGKPAADLSPAEAALLAGLPQAPTRLSPHTNFAGARKRQAWILRGMRDLGFLAAEDFDRASREPLRLQPPRRTFLAPHFVDLLVRLDPTAGGPSATGAARRTTLDLPLQRFSEKVLGDHLAGLRAQGARNGAVVVLDNRAGEVLALVGSENYFDPDAGQVNGAWAARSPGSALKPFTYLLALERGFTPADILADVPSEFATPTGVFAPANYERRCHGPVRLRTALACSLNIPAVRVLNSLGGPEPLWQRLQQCGLTTLTKPAEHYGLGLTLGNAEVRLLELANAYACLARLGEFRPFRLVAAGATPAAGPRLFDPAAAWLLADILSDNEARAPAFGRHSSLRFDFPVAAKTGTSSDFRDNWAFAYTPEFTVGVWVGNFSGEPMREMAAVAGAAPVMHEIMRHLRQTRGTTWFPRPEGIVELSIDPLTGHQVAEDRPGAGREKFLAANPPKRASPSDYDAAGRLRLSAEYGDWLANEGAWLAGRATVEPRQEAGTLRILSPLPGTVFFLDPDLPDSGRLLPLRAAGGPGMEWRSRSLSVTSRRGAPFAELREGRHELTVSHPSSGSASTWVLVKKL